MATKHQKDTEKLAFGAYTGTIYRRTDLKESSYFLRVFIKEEGKYIRRSLQTDDVVQARKAATEQIIQIFTKVESGQRVISISLAELKRKFWIQRESLVAQGQVSKNTLDNHATRISHGMRFLDSKGKGIHTLISSLDGNIWNGYLEWRFADAISRGKNDPA